RSVAVETDITSCPVSTSSPLDASMPSSSSPASSPSAPSVPSAFNSSSTPSPNPRPSASSAATTAFDNVIENSDTPHQIAQKLFAALKNPDDPNPDFALAIIADAVEYEAAVDGEPVGFDDENEIVDALANSTLFKLKYHKGATALDSSQSSAHHAKQVWNV